MTDKKPKPFHIGTQVFDRGNREKCAVHSAYGSMVWCLYGSVNGGLFAAPTNVDALVHADDGSPLGEWVPINWDAYPAMVFAFDPEVRKKAQAYINAIIRGEVEQSGKAVDDQDGGTAQPVSDPGRDPAADPEAIAPRSEIDARIHEAMQYVGHHEDCPTRKCRNCGWSRVSHNGSLAKCPYTFGGDRWEPGICGPPCKYEELTKE